MPASAPSPRGRKPKRRPVEVSLVEAGTSSTLVMELSPPPPPVVEVVEVVEVVTETAVATAPAEPRILVFDCETTGTDKKRDQIIELCVQFGLDDGAESTVWRFRPQTPISPGAQAVQ